MVEKWWEGRLYVVFVTGMWYTGSLASGSCRVLPYHLIFHRHSNNNNNNNNNTFGERVGSLNVSSGERWWISVPRFQLTDSTSWGSQQIDSKFPSWEKYVETYTCCDIQSEYLNQMYLHTYSDSSIFQLWNRFDKEILQTRTRLKRVLHLSYHLQRDVGPEHWGMHRGAISKGPCLTPTMTNLWATVGWWLDGYKRKKIGSYAIDKYGHILLRLYCYNYEDEISEYNQ